MLKNYIKIALRNLVKHKGYSFINISGLAVGIAICLLILMYVRHELSYDRFHENADRIVRVNLVSEGTSIAVSPSMIAPAFDQVAPEIENWVRLYEPTRYSPAIVSVGEENFQEESFFYADSSFFDVFTFEFIAGNRETALSNPKNLVLTESTAIKLFGDTDVVGNIVKARIFNTENDFEVTGVIENVSKNSHFSFDYLGSLSTMQGWSQLSDTDLRSANFYTYLLLNSPNALSSLEQKTNDFIQQNIPDEWIEGMTLTPLTDIYLRSNVDFDIRPMGDIKNVYGFSFLAFLILLIATINYINLATARSSKRGAEVGIRKALGAVRSQLVKQFYGESIILTLISVAIALIIVEVFKNEFFALMGQDVQLNLLNDPIAWILLISVTIITAALAGSYPAFLLSSYQPVKVLKGLFGTKASDGALRKGLVVFQFAISIFLILSTAIIFQQTNFMLSSDLGFDEEQVIVLPARDSELAPKQDLLKSEILRQAGVINATYMSNIPGRVFGGYGSQHTPNSEIVSTAAGAADPDLIETLGMELLAGEGFPDNPSYSREQGYVYILNEKLANAHGWTPDEAVGKRFNVLGDREGEVAGVVKDFNYASLREQVEPLALFINEEMYNYLLVKLAPENVEGTLSAIGNVWREIAPHRPFEFDFMDQQLNALYEAEIQTRNLLTLFTILAILIACLGLVGLSSFLIERRAKEIGIRKVLGASVANIVTLLSSDFLKLIAAGFLIGIPVAWYLMETWLQNFAYRIDIGLMVFLITGVFALIVALLTISWQSISAALRNPVHSLKRE